MIHQYKIDDRLIHGMVYMTWFPKFKINRAIIVDDNIAVNETRKMALRLGMPQSAKLVIWSVDKAAEKLIAGVDQGNNVIVIVNSPVWLLGLMNKGVEIKEVCCGNNSSSGADSVQVSGTLYASKEDLAAYKEMINRGVRFYWQTTPEVVPEELNEKLLKL